MAPSPYPVQSLLEPAGASSERIASPWRGRDRSSSPRPDAANTAQLAKGEVHSQQPATPTSPLSPSPSPGRRHYPNARAEKNHSPVAPESTRSTCPLTPSVVPPWMLPGVKNRLDKSKRVQDLAGSLDISCISFSSPEKTQAQRAFNIFNIPNMDVTSRKGRLGLHSKSLPPEVFGAAPTEAVEASPKRPRAVPESPEIPCCGIVQPVVVRPAEKTTRSRLTGPDLRALAEMEEVDVVQSPMPRRPVKDIISVSFKPLLRGGKSDSRTSGAQSTATGITPITQSLVPLISNASAA